MKSGTVPNFGSVENQSGKSTIFGSVDAMNQHASIRSIAFNSGQNHTGTTQKKVNNKSWAVIIRLHFNLKENLKRVSL